MQGGINLNLITNRGAPLNILPGLNTDRQITDVISLLDHTSRKYNLEGMSALLWKTANLNYTDRPSGIRFKSASDQSIVPKTGTYPPVHVGLLYCRVIIVDQKPAPSRLPIPLWPMGEPAKECVFRFRDRTNEMK